MQNAKNSALLKVRGIVLDFSLNVNDNHYRLKITGVKINQYMPKQQQRFFYLSTITKILFRVSIFCLLMWLYAYSWEIIY